MPPITGVSGNDPRGRLQNEGDYLREQREGYYNPYIEEAYGNMGQGNQQAWNDYGNIQGGYDTIMGMPGGGQQRPPQQPASQQGGSIAPSQEAIMALFPNGMTPEALKAAQPKLLQMGIHLQNEARGDLRPRMLMPDGNTVDLGDWGGKAQWQERGNLGDWHGAYERGERGLPQQGGQGGSSQGGMSTFGEFATTGGYSPEDMANMRARGVSPVRAAYENAEREVSRNRSLQGGYSPNMAPTLAKMARERGQATADAATNVEASLATMKNQGKQFGLSGMQGALAGKTGLYGSTPGMANMFGSQALNAANQATGHGNTAMSNATQAQQLPGQFDTTTNRIGTIAGIAGNVANAARRRY